MILFWPFLVLFQRFLSTRSSAIATTEEVFKMREKRKEDVIISARAQIIEVSIEASFQPLLQLYLLLPTLLDLDLLSGNQFLALFSITEVVGEFQRVQFWSIMTSMISLSWSFTFYQAVQKNGALDFGSNPAGRVMLILANFLQISSRLLALILYAYTFGDGNFWPMIASVMVHILLMSGLHYYTSDEWHLETFKHRPLKIIYHCLINGICNLYLHNWIVQINKTVDRTATNTKKSMTNKQKRKTKKNGTGFRQLLFDTIFIVENLLILITSYLILDYEICYQLFVFVALSQYFGIALKSIYYWKFHIWSTSFHHKTWYKKKKNVQEAHRSQERIKTSEIQEKLETSTCLRD